jgi:xanthine dehydrogenase small subunit
MNELSLSGINIVNGNIEIGDNVTMAGLMNSPVIQESYPSLHKHIMPDMTTVAGNIIKGYSAGDLVIWLLAMNATVVLRNKKEREIPLRDFYTGYNRLAKSEDENVVKILFNNPDAYSRFNFEKDNNPDAPEIVSVNSALGLHLEDGMIRHAHLSAGGVAPLPLFLKNTSSCLNGKSWPFSDSEWKELDFLLQSEILPVSDNKGSAESKRKLLHQQFRTHFQEIFEEARQT